MGTFPESRLSLGLGVLGLVLAGGCEEDRGSIGVGVDCFACHDRGALTAARGSDSDGPREWMQASSRGLLATTSPFTGEVGFTLEWPRRGRHPDSALDFQTCYQCHPVSEGGEKHSLDAYPPGAVRAGGDCASSCHLWLPPQVQSAGFGGRTYSGTARPHEMLMQVVTGHTRVFQEGYPAGAPREDEVKVRFIAPGCVGCHTVDDSRHGAITACTGCHSFATATPGAADRDGGPHEMHLALIQQGRAATELDPEEPGDCAFCHRFEAEQSLSHAICYNCHLSGHQPVMGGGEAHFWP